MDIYFIAIFGGLYTLLFFLMVRQILHINGQQLLDSTRKYSLAKLTHATKTQAANYFVALFAYMGGFSILNQMFVIANFNRFERDAFLIFSVVSFYFSLQLMMGYWQTFHVEAKFGFNQSTRRLFFLDQGKKWLLMMAMAALAQICIMIGADEWWLVLWFAFMVGLTQASRIQSWFYDTLSPLPEGELHNRITQLASECNYDFTDIFVVDKSTRSMHSNAYFTGVGKNKRVVLDDNLLNQLDDDAIIGVCAHELGHYQLRHESKFFALIGLMVLASFLLVDALYQPQWLNLPQDVTPLLPILVLAPVVTFLVSPILMAVSRRFEWQADEFATRYVPAEYLAQALEKLTEHNKMVRTADRFYQWFYYSHPPIAERLDALRRGDQ